jgi:hypothetical protein
MRSGGGDRAFSSRVLAVARSRAFAGLAVGTLLATSLVSVASSPPAGAAAAFGPAYCQGYRWDVKTGQDPEAGQINVASVTPTAVDFLTNIPAELVLPDDFRLAPTELTQYQITATIVGVEHEADGDYHVRLTDGSSPNQMVTELPDPACIPPADPFALSIAQARSALVANLATAVGSTVAIRGPGFFDSNKEVSNVAPNKIELHPVLGIDFHPPPPPPLGPPPPIPPPPGYRTVASDGGIFTFGGAGFYGSTGAIHLNRPIVGMDSIGGGYWLVASDGGVFAFGTAKFHGSTGGQPLNQPIVGMTSTPQGSGYWLVAADGGVFAFGTAQFYGSTGAIHLNRPIVAAASTADGRGYWLVASDGGVFAFGDAAFYGSTGGQRLNAPIVGAASTPDGHGYWLVGSDGGVFAGGDAGFYGSTGNLHLNRPVVGMAATQDGHGYWLVGSDGGVFAGGDAPFLGSMGGRPLNAPMVAVSAA